MIRRFIEFAIDKPLLNHMFMVFIILLSIFSYINIPKEIFPPVQMDKISISGVYAGTSADVLDKMAVKNIEDDLKNIDALDDIKTTIKNGVFSMIIDIKPGSENMSVLNDVKDVISKVKRDLPSDMNEPIAKIHVNVIPLALIAIAGDVPKKELLRYADELKSSLSAFKDLSDIAIRGDADDELVIRINEEKIRALSLDMNLVVSALQSLSSIFPIGTIKEQGAHLYISTYNGEKEQGMLEETQITVGDQRVRLGDIAEVSFELSDETELSHFNGLKNISLNINKAKTGNAIALVKEIRTVMKQYEKKYPHITFEIYTDTSVWIKNRLNTVFANILFGLMLVFLAMLIFVNRGIALVVAMGIPMSFMIGLIATNYVGYSLNMLSLLGALIALGMLVDEAIVVAENIYRHLEEGKSRREATIVGSLEMFPAVLTATMTTVFAFLPLLLITGEMGTFIKILPVMISILLISSLFEAFYFLPLHSYQLLRIRKEAHMTHSIWQHLWRWYDVVLHTVFKRRILSLVLMASLILSATVMLATQSKFQLFPDFDVTQVYVSGKVNINNDLHDTEAIVTKIEKILLEKLDKEDVSSVTSVIGMRMDAKNRAELNDNLFQVFIDLHERAPDNFFNKYINPILSVEYDGEVLKRHTSAIEISEHVREWLEPLKALKKEGEPLFEELSVTTAGTGVVAHDVEIALSGKRDAELLDGLEQLKQALGGIEGVHDISDDADIGERELKLRVNEYGQTLGFNEQVLNAQLRSYYLKGEYGKMFNDEGLIRIKVEGQQKDTLDSIYNFEVQIPGTTQRVALRDVSDFIFEKSFVKITKENSKRIRSVFASLNKKILTS